MSLRNTDTTYGSVSKFFHWFVFLLVIGMLCLGPFMEDFSKPIRTDIFTAHKSIGLTILFLMLSRLLWTLVNPRPKAAEGIKQLETKLAHLMHALLYFCVISITLVGWAMSTAADRLPKFFWLLQIPALPGVPLGKPTAKLFSATHTALAIALAILIVLHIVAALKHHFIYKNDTLKRMMPAK